MKLTKLLLIVVFLFSQFTFFGCKRQLNTPKSSLSEQIIKYNKDFTLHQIGKGKNYRTTAIDKAKATKLAMADASGAVSWGAKWFVPVIGAYGGLWNAFFTSKIACTWCPTQALNAAGGSTNLLNELATINSDIQNVSNNNPYNNLGNQHNILMCNFATTATIDENYQTLTTAASNYILSDNFMSLTTTQKNAVISNLNASIPSMLTSFNDTDTANIDMLIMSYTDVPYGVRSDLVTINDYISGNEMDNSDFVQYITGLEDIIISDEDLSSNEQNYYLYYFAIIKYSYNFWYLAS